MVAPRLGEIPEYTVVAEEQHEYKPVTAAIVRNEGYGSKRPDGLNTVVCAYELAPEELSRLMAGELLYIHFLTFGGPLTPHIVTTGDGVTKEMYKL